MTTPDIPRLRPHAFGGKAYYTELRAILLEITPALIGDVAVLLGRNSKITVADLCRLALKYELNLKATCKALEDLRILPCGAYDALLDRGFKPMAALREVAVLMEAARDE